MGTDAQRAKLYTLVADKLGEEAADTVMAVLPPWDHAEVARQVDVQMVKVELEIVKVALEAKIDRLDAKIDHVQVDLEAKIDKLEVTMVAKMDQQFARLLTWTFGMMIAFAGLILAAASIA